MPTSLDLNPTASRRRGRLGLAAGLAAALIALSPGAQAQEYGVAQTGPDAVVLKDGGVIRGTLSEMVPGDHAKVLLATGQVATIRWDVIARIDRGGATGQAVAAPTSPGPPPAATPTPLPLVAPGAAGNAYVHLDADSGVQLELQSQGTWTSVCNAPCDREVPLDGNYRVAGGGLRTSHTFRLLASRPHDRVVVSVDAASKGGFVGGIILTSLGTPTAIVGGLVVLAAAAIDSSSSELSTGGMKVVGWSMLGLGLAGAITGIVLISNNARTGVDQFNDAAKAARLGSAEVAIRLPLWHEATTPAPAATGVAMPLFTTHF